MNPGKPRVPHCEERPCAAHSRRDHTSLSSVPCPSSPSTRDRSGVSGAQTEFDVTRHAESTVTQWRCSSRLLFNKALEKAKADVTELTTLLDAGEADLAETEKSSVLWSGLVAGFRKGFVEVSMELTGVTPYSNRRRVELRSRVLCEVHRSAELRAVLFGRRRESHTARSGQVPHTPGGTIFVMGYGEPKIINGTHTARSDQESHTPGGSVTSVDLGTLRRHRGLWV